MTRRTIVLGTLALLLAVIIVAMLMVRWLDDGPRQRLAAILSDALDRQVTIGALDVDAAAGAVELRDVAVANPEGVGGPPLLELRHVRLEVELRELLGRRVVGRVVARGLDLRIVRHAEGTNLDGMLPTRAQRPDRPPPEVHLDFRVEEGHVSLEDLERGQTLDLGGAALEGLVSNRDRTPHAEARLEIAEVSLADVSLLEVELVARGSADGVQIPSLRGTVGQRGRLTGSGSLDMRSGNRWSFELAAQGVALDEDVTPIVQRVLPLLATATRAPNAPVRGLVDAEIRLGGRGLAWDSIRPTLAGTGELTVRELVVPADALLVSLAALAGRPPKAWEVERAFATFAIDEGWVELSRVESGDEKLELPVDGRVSLDGELDLRIDLMPLVELFGGGVYEEVARYATSIPVRIGGTVDQPALRPPSATEVMRSLGGGLLRRGAGTRLGAPDESSPGARE